MGEQADYLIDQGMDACWGLDEWEDYEDTPAYISVYISVKKCKKPTGPGNCPICKGPTKKKLGKFGEFYGCILFPKCKGSRGI
jgi:hypothetical protein